jgi:flagellar hook-associated protein 2
MSGIVSDVGLFSGLPVQDIINQLMAIEAQPLARVQTRIQGLQSERTAYADISARLLGLKSAASRFDTTALFRAAAARSSDPDVLTATAEDGAATGTYAFRVRSLTSSHQLISRGFADSDRSAVGSGTVSIEVGNGHVAPLAFLDDLNGFTGIRRGSIEIQDQNGGTATLDLTDAMTVNDVVARINAEPTIDVKASITGDGFKLVDLSGGAGALVVRDVGGGFMAEDLGIAGSIAASSGRELLGRDIRDLHDSTPLALLNDGNGVGRNPTNADLVFSDGGATLFEVELGDRMDETTHLSMVNDGNGVSLSQVMIRLQDESEIEVDLAAAHLFDGESAPRTAQTIGDVIEVFNAAAPPDSYVMSLDINTNQLVLTDATTGDGTLEVVDVDGAAAQELGLTAEPENGAVRSAEIYRVQTIGDVLRAINFADGNYDNATGSRDVTATLVDNGIRIERAGGDFSISAGVLGEKESAAPVDLGLLGSSEAGRLDSRRLLAGLNTVLLSSLNGGQGVELGTLEITASDGSAFAVDLSSPLPDGRSVSSLQDVLDRINSVADSLGIDVHAQVSRAGSGIALLDHTRGAGALSVADTSAARAFGLAERQAGLDGSLQGANLQLQYIDETTVLDTLNQGSGVGTGTFEITARSGATMRIDIGDNQKTIGDVVDLINVLGGAVGIQAGINSNGDGITVTDSSEGTATLSIADDDGQVARRLRLTSDAQPITTTIEDPDNPGTFIDVEQHHIDGSYEVRIEVDADDTLSDVATKINQAGLDVSAAVINDGSQVSPFRLSIASGVTGTAGTLVLDTGPVGLGLSTLVAPQDAVVFFGGSADASPVVIRSSTNSLTDVIDGVNIDLVGTSDDPVELTVSRDVDQVISQISGFVEAYNGVITRIDELTFFDSESLESGVLRGESTIRRVDARLRALVTGAIPTDNNLVNRLSSIGITFREGGTIELGDGETGIASRDGTIEFDEARFREVFADDPEAVEEFFTLSRTFEETQITADGVTQVVIDPLTGEPRTVFEGQGLGFKIDEIVDLLTRTGDGLLTLRDQALQNQEDLFNDRVEAIGSLLAAKRERLERQFAALEESISSLTSQQSSLTALQGL